MPALISRRAHGLADYAYVALTALAPRLLGFGDQHKAAALCRGISAATLAYTLSTRAEWGACKLIPYKAHLATDLAAGIANVAMPWVMGFSGHRRARNTVIAFGVIGIAASLLSGVLSGRRRP